MSNKGQIKGEHSFFLPVSLSIKKFKDWLKARKSAIIENSESDKDITCINPLKILLNSDNTFSTLDRFLIKVVHSSEAATRGVL